MNFESSHVEKFFLNEMDVALYDLKKAREALCGAQLEAKAAQTALRNAEAVFNDARQKLEQMTAEYLGLFD